ncbi:MAG: DUF3500 domain-containing protein [Pseudomonadota bacterium]
MARRKQDKTNGHSITRRGAVATAAAALAIAGSGSGMGAGLGAGLGAARATTVQPADAGTGRVLRQRVQAWLATLDEGQRDRATFAFDSRTRRAWNYMLGSRFANGLALEQMRGPQKDAARDVLATALSAWGLETAENIMLQQDILRDEWGKGSAERNRERFSMQVFGTPSADAPWAWRWEGHHLTITVTMIGDAVVSTTPKAFSSEPNTVPSGPYRGLVVLENEALGRTLFGDLGAGARRAALLRDRSYGNILAKPGREATISRREGLALGDMTPGQADIARRLVALYTSEHLAGPLAADAAARIAGEDEAAIRFGWAGPNQAGESLYYRLHGQGFLIEFATLFGQPEHHHTVVHDLQRNFGDHLLG